MSSRLAAGSNGDRHISFNTRDEGRPLIEELQLIGHLKSFNIHQSILKDKRADIFIFIYVRASTMNPSQ
jgi:hypothetical protein